MPLFLCLLTRLHGVYLAYGIFDILKAREKFPEKLCVKPAKARREKSLIILSEISMKCDVKDHYREHTI